MKMQRFFTFNLVRDCPRTGTVPTTVNGTDPAHRPRHPSSGGAGSVGKHRHSRVACAERMGDARRRGSRDDVSRTNRMLLVAEDADPVAFEDHEELLLHRVAMLGRAQLSGRDPVVVDPGVDGAGGHAEIPTLDAYVATAPLRGLDL